MGFKQKFFLWVACVFLLFDGLNLHAHNIVVDLRSFFDVPRDQGPRRGTCGAFAATSLAEFLLRRQYGVMVALSPSYTYWAARRRAMASPFPGLGYKDIDGLSGHMAVDSLVQDGVVTEAHWPYQTQLPRPMEGPLLPTDLAQDRFSGEPPSGVFLEPFRFESQYIERPQIASFLMTQQRPVAVNIMWYYRAEMPGGRLRLPTVEEQQACRLKREFCMGHVVLLVGYNSETGEFRFRNSWGTGWGDAGYGILPLAYLMEQCEVCHVLPRLHNYTAAVQEFYKRASGGMSARLLAR